MNLPSHPHTALLLLSAALLVATAGCSASRPGLRSIEPEWSHHDAAAKDTSDNDQAWDRFAANRAMGASRSAQVSNVDTPVER